MSWLVSHSGWSPGAGMCMHPSSLRWVLQDLAVVLGRVKGRSCRCRHPLDMQAHADMARCCFGLTGMGGCTPSCSCCFALGTICCIVTGVHPPMGHKHRHARRQQQTCGSTNCRYSSRRRRASTGLAVSTGSSELLCPPHTAYCGCGFQ